MNRVYNFSDKPSAIQDSMEILRNKEKQGDRSLFRSTVRNIGRYLAFEISKLLRYGSITIQTPMAEHKQQVLIDQLVAVTILRAGLPLHEGVLDVFPQAENGFISAYRKHRGDDFSIEVGYVACPDLSGKVLLLVDPMLATGQSFINAWKALEPYGKPSRVILVAVIGSEAGLEYLRKEAPGDFELFVAAVDPELDERKYIIPGLGDAGDLAFGEKLQK